MTILARSGNLWLDADGTVYRRGGDGEDHERIGHVERLPRWGDLTDRDRMSWYTLETKWHDDANQDDLKADANFTYQLAKGMLA